MAPRHSSTIFKPIEVRNPFRDSSDKAYADILADKMREVNWWRMVGVVSLALFAVSLILFSYATNQQKTVPVLVNVMPSGEASFLGEVRQGGAMQVPDAAILFQVRTFIANLRSVSTDYQVVYNNIDDCYQMITSSYQQSMTRTLRENSPFELVGRVRRTVQIESILNVTARSYQVDWLETTVDSGSNRKASRMRALVSVRLIPPTDDTIRRNPLGIYIENCEMTEL